MGNYGYNVTRDLGLTEEEEKEFYWGREDENPKNQRYSDEDRRNARNCRSSIDMTDDQKLNAASKLGENWANILSGMGDQ